MIGEPLSIICNNYVAICEPVRRMQTVHDLYVYEPRYEKTGLRGYYQV